MLDCFLSTQKNHNQEHPSRQEIRILGLLFLGLLRILLSIPLTASIASAFRQKGQSTVVEGLPSWEDKNSKWPFEPEATSKKAHRESMQRGSLVHTWPERPGGWPGTRDGRCSWRRPCDTARLRIEPCRVATQSTSALERSV